MSLTLRRFAPVLFVASAILLTTGCNSNAKKLVGKWKITGLGEEADKMGDKMYAYFEFKPDGNGQFGVEITDPEFKKMFGEGKDMNAPFKYKLNGDTLELTDFPKEGPGGAPFGKKEKATAKLKFEGNDKIVLTPDDEKDKEKPAVLTRMK